MNNITTYAKIAFTVLKTIAEKNFYFIEGAKTTRKRYLKNIHNLLRNFYNSRMAPDSQKQILKADPTVKVLLLDILEYHGVLKADEKEPFEFNLANMELFKEYMNINPTTKQALPGLNIENVCLPNSQEKLIDELKKDIEILQHKR